MWVGIACLMVGGLLGFIIALCLVAMRTGLPSLDPDLDELVMVERLRPADPKFLAAKEMEI